MKNKYGNKKYEGYDSKKEYYRSNELKLLQRAGEITNFQEQVTYELVPSQWKVIDGKKKCIEHAVKYIADFQYTDKAGNTIVEDTKGFKTEVYKIKKKLMLHVHGIKIREA